MAVNLCTAVSPKMLMQLNTHFFVCASLITLAQTMFLFIIIILTSFCILSWKQANINCLLYIYEVINLSVEKNVETQSHRGTGFGGRKKKKAFFVTFRLLLGIPVV